MHETRLRERYEFRSALADEIRKSCPNRATCRSRAGDGRAFATAQADHVLGTRPSVRRRAGNGILEARADIGCVVYNCLSPSLDTFKQCRHEGLAGGNHFGRKGGQTGDHLADVFSHLARKLY